MGLCLSTEENNFENEGIQEVLDIVADPFQETYEYDAQYNSSPQPQPYEPLLF